MIVKQKGRGSYASIKYSKIPMHENTPVSRADWAMQFLLKNGYAIMQGMYINEILKLIRSLRELGIEYTMKTIEGQNEYIAHDKKWKEMYYEFTTVYFEDDSQQRKV